jgi:hypothetical protein
MNNLSPHRSPSPRRATPAARAVLALTALALAFGAGWQFSPAPTAKRALAAAKPSSPSKKMLTAAPNNAPRTPWDPKGALAQVFTKHAGGDRFVAFLDLLKTIPANGFAALVDALYSCPYPGERPDFLKMAYSMWVTQNPQAAFVHALAESRRTGALEPVPYVIEAWAGLDPQAALAAAKQIPGTSQRGKIVNSVLQNWVEIDPKSAYAALRALPPGIGDYGAFFDHWARADAVGAFAALSTISDPNKLHAAQTSVLKVMAGDDPSQAFALVAKLPASQQSPSLWSAVFRSWASVDPAGALKALSAVPAGENHLQAVEALFMGWSEVDPNGAVVAAQALPAGREQQLAIMDAFRNFAAFSPSTAADFLATQPPGLVHNMMLDTLVVQWSDTDPASAIAWLGKNALGTSYDDAVRSILTKVADTDPVSAMDLLAALPDGTQRASYQQDIIKAWAANDPDDALAWVDNNLTGATHDNAHVKVMNYIIQEDPISAAPIVAQMPASPARNAAFLAESLNLARQDADAAIEWAENLPDDTPPVNRHNLNARIINAAYKTDPDSVASFLQNYIADPQYASLFDKVAKQWSQADSPSAVNWIESLPEGDVRASALNNALPELANYDPASAWDVAINELPQSDSAQQTSDNTLDTILTNWSKTDPAGAAKAALAYPDQSDDGPGAQNRLKSIQAIATTWLKQDPTAAAKWIATLPSGENRDNAVVPLIALQLKTDPAMAFDTAASISQTDDRYLQVTKIATAWAKTDPAAAIAAVKNSPLSPDQAAFLLQTLQVSPTKPAAATSSVK